MKTVAFLAFLIGGCVNPEISVIRYQAAFEMNCKKEGLDVWQIGKRSYAAEGCGHRAVYHHVNGVYVRQLSLEDEIAKKK